MGSGIVRSRTIGSFEEFHKIVREYRSDRQWVFRGHSSLEWDLVPKIGRAEYEGLDREKFFDSFKRRAIEFTSVRPETEWDWIALAQHHKGVVKGSVP